MKLIQSIFGASWKTTAAGYGTAAVLAAAAFIQSHGDLSTVDYKQLGTAVGIALLGRFAKDHNVSNAPSPSPDPKTV